MIFSDGDIVAAQSSGRITISPFDVHQLQSASYDVRLDNYFRIFDNSEFTHIDPKIEHPTKLVEIIPGQPFVLHPGEFALGSTVESVSLDDTLAARLEGKSSLARLGLLAHATAGFIDPGFTGQVTLELASVANLPILLWPGMKIGQLCFMQLKTPADIPYNMATNHYQDQIGPTPSRAHLQFD